MNEEDELMKQIDAFSISSAEERITEQLHKTGLTENTTPVIFRVPERTDPPISHQQQEWNPNSNAESNQQDDGWGEAPPSYTTISQNTYFGFNSIWQAASLTNENVINDNDNNNINNEQFLRTKLFSQFVNRPVTFSSSSDNDDKNVIKD